MRMRPRRLRRTLNIRALVRETHLSCDDLIYPIFVVPGVQVKAEISALPGQFHWSVDRLPEVIDQVLSCGIKAVLLFGLPEGKDCQGSESFAKEGVVQKAIRLIKAKAPDLVVITDVCLCSYTDHGHCGVIEGDNIANDSTLSILQKIAVSHAEAGADWVAPSGMMDGMIEAIRDALDEHGYSDVSILSYAVKYASSFYGPFRVAADCAPKKGDRQSYQMDPANAREALKEAALDVEEGTDLLMVKPGLAYLDIVHQLKAQFDVPVVVYHVSGEYSMVKAAAERGWLDGSRVMLESLLSMKRAGADLIITYAALEMASLLAKKS